MPNTDQSRKKASAVKEAKRRVEAARAEFLAQASWHRAVAASMSKQAVLVGQAMLRRNEDLMMAERTLRAVTNAKSGEEAWALLEEDRS